MIPIDRLRAFNAFVRLGSMSAAAKELGLTQPAISIQLRSLEESCPEKVFYFSGKKKELTAFGRRLFDLTTESLVALEQQVYEALENSESIVRSRIRVAGRLDILERILDPSKAGLSSQLEVMPCSSEVAASMVVDRQADIAVTYHVPQSSSLIAKRLFSSFPIVAYAKEDKDMQKSFKAGALSAENMQSHQWLVYKKDDPILVKLCTLHKIPISSLRFKLVAPSWPLLQRAALRGDGVALLPSEYVENESRLKIVMKLAEEYGLHYHLLYPKELSKQKNLQNFIATLLA